MFSSHQPPKEEYLIKLYHDFTNILGENENDCFRIEEAAKALDYAFTNTRLRRNQPGEFKTFLCCVVKYVQNLIQPYLDKKTGTASNSGRKEVTSLIALKPIFPVESKLGGIDKRIKRIYLFVAHIETEYKKDCDNPSDPDKVELESARVKYALDSEESGDEDDPNFVTYDKPKQKEQSRHGADTNLIVNNKTKWMKGVKHSNPDFLAGQSKRTKLEFLDDIPKETLEPSNGKERKFSEDDDSNKSKPVTLRSQNIKKSVNKRKLDV